MMFGRHPAILSASGSSASFMRALQPAAWFRADTGVTVTGSGASMVADQADLDNALVLPGVAGNYASAPDSVPLSITGDIDIRVRVALDDWTPSANNMLVNKSDSSGTQRSYFFQVVITTGLLNFGFSPDGTLGSQVSQSSSAAPTFTDGTAYWVRVTRDVATGTVTFYTAADSATMPTSWTQLGTTAVLSAGSAPFNSTSILEVGTTATGMTSPAKGKIYRASIYSTIGGTTPVFDANFAAQTKGATSFSESSSNAATVTVNQSGALPAHIGSQKDLLMGTDAYRPPYLAYSGTKYLYLPGVAGNYASTPDSAANSITGDIDIRVRVALDDWTPATTNRAIIGKYVATGNQKSFLLEVKTTGLLQFYTSADGATTTLAESSVGTGFTDGAAYWVRVTRVSATGAAKIYTAADSATDPTSWAQLGTDLSTTAGGIFDGTAGIELGTHGAGAFDALGPAKIYRAIIKNGIDGTTVVDFNPGRDASDGSTSFASSATGETWTVNSSGGLPAQIVGRPSLLFDGSADYLKCNAFTLNQPETVYIAFKQVSWTLNDIAFDGNGATTGSLQQSGSSPAMALVAGSSAASNSGLAVGSYGIATAIFNGASSSLQINNGTPATGNAGANNMGGFTLGARSIGDLCANIQVLEAILFSTAHDANQRARVIQYLAGRHGIAL